MTFLEADAVVYVVAECVGGATAVSPVAVQEEAKALDPAITEPYLDDVLTENSAGTRGQ